LTLHKKYKVSNAVARYKVFYWSE